MPPKSKVSPGAQQLQDKLHNLLSTLSRTIAHVKQWPPEQSLSANNTDKLCKHMREVLAAAHSVETTLKDHQAEYQNCWIPLDLLELLEYSGTKTDKEYGLHPDCFLRGLLKEATGQLTGLKRRKLALERLGAAVQMGLIKSNDPSDSAQTTPTAKAGSKRKQSVDEDKVDTTTNVAPPEKKLKTEEE